MAYHRPTLEIEPQLIRSHYSAISSHRECEAKWYYRYVLKLRAPDFGPKPEMHFGSWWGALTAAEGLERGRRLGSLKADPTGSQIGGPDDSPRFDQRTVTVADIFMAADQWWKSRDFETKEMWDAKLGEGLPNRLAALYDVWMDRYAEERKNEQPLGFEIFWKRRAPRPKSDLEWLGPEGDMLQAIDLIGYIDEAYFDTQRGIVIIRDKKSHKVLKTHTAVDDMMDSQLQLYGWGATPLIEEWGLGAPRAVAYDRARSVAPKSPEVTKTAGALSKSVTDYDLATYVKWARTDTRPTEEIAAWLEKVVPTAAVDENGEPYLAEPEIKATPEQIAFVTGLPPGQFWGEFGAFLLSGARKGLPKFGVYQEEQSVMEKLAMPSASTIWFQRTRVPLNRNVVIGHLRAAIDTATDAWRTKRRVDITGDAPRSLGKACDWCDYGSLCRDRLMGGALGEYDLREHGLVEAEGRTLLINGKLEHDTRPEPELEEAFA